MITRKIKINRAPVLTLWAVVVAERLGYAHDTALTLGKAVAGLNAQSKGRSLGIFKPGEKPAEKEKGRKKGEEFSVELLGRAVSVVQTEAGIRAAIKGKATEPENVKRYLKSKFGDALPEVRQAMQKLARSRRPDPLALQAYSLYEEFRPEIPAGTKGWGAQGELDLEYIVSLSRNARVDQRKDGRDH
jgi:hypothetical protein